MYACMLTFRCVIQEKDKIFHVIHLRIFYTGMTLQVRLKFDPKMAYPVQRSLDLFGLLRTMAIYVTETFELIPWLRTILTIAWALGS